MMRTIAAALFAVPIAIASPAAAATRHSIDLPSTNLSRSISALSVQSGASIGSVNVDLSRYNAPALKGKYTLRQALKRLLRKTNLDFVIMNDRTARIVRKRSQPRKAISSKKAMPRRLQPPQITAETIVVTASKQGALLKDYSGSAQIIDIASASPTSESGGLEGLINTLPTTAQTNLGPGRNKLFLRGIADSSLIGTTQSTVGLYLDETRLSYSGPNPDLRSYDQSRIEVLEGPQGTLFGAGTIGGIVKMVTNKPKLDAVAGTVWASVGATSGGDASYDIASMINLPVTDYIAFRALGYYQRDGGYIDDIGRNLNNINRSDIFGGRLGVRFEPGNDWIIDLNLTHQSNDTRDGQYAERNLAKRTRISTVAQPFDANFSSAALTVSKQWDNFELISSLGYTDHKKSSTFDATILSETMASMIFEEQISSDLISHETRLRWNGDRGNSAVFGISLLNNRDLITLDIGEPDDTVELSKTSNENFEGAVFGEVNYPVTNRVSATVGGRLTYSRVIADIVLDDDQELDPSREIVRFLPKVALSWKPDSNGLIYASYQQGFRSGGISIGLGDDNPITQFDSDTIETIEAGVKIGRRADSDFTANIAFFYSNWNDIQADLIDEAGFPRTSNIGDGKVYGVSLGFDWAVLDQLSVYGRFFANESELIDTSDDFEVGDESRLPNIAELGGNLGLSFILPLPQDRQLTFQSDVRYVGSSQLGLDPFLSLPQGDYVTLNGAVQLQSGNWRLSLNVENLLNSEANIFALGNPFTVADGLQTTPLRPRNFTLAAKTKF